MDGHMDVKLGVLMCYCTLECQETEWAKETWKMNPESNISANLLLSNILQFLFKKRNVVKRNGIERFRDSVLYFF